MRAEMRLWPDPAEELTAFPQTVDPLARIGKREKKRTGKEGAKKGRKEEGRGGSEGLRSAPNKFLAIRQRVRLGRGI